MLLPTGTKMFKNSCVNCRNSLRGIPIQFIAGLTTFLCILCFMIGVPILIFGYTPRVLTDNQYLYVTSNVIGYGQESIDCVYQCNCRLVCRPTRPNCRNSWEKYRVCDTCTTPCINAWVVYSVLPPNPSYTFNAFYTLNQNPLPYLQATYPLNSTMGGYYTTSPESMVYGDRLNTSINCFIAGFFFTGLGFLVTIAFFVSLALYCIGRTS